MRKLKVHLLLAILSGLVAASRPAAAQNYLPTSNSTEMVTISSATLDSILNRISALEKDKQKDDEQDPWEDVSNEKWKTKWGGRALGDYVMFPNQSAGNQARFGDLDNYFEYRRLRFFAEGEGYGVFMYKLQMDWEPEGVADVADSGMIVKDCYVGVQEVPWLGTVIIGHSKEPTSLEQLTSSKYITFMERGLPIMFFGDERRLGIHAANYTASEALVWDYGAFFAPPVDEDHQFVADNPGIRLAGRVCSAPYYCEGGRHLVHVGLSGAWQDMAEGNQWRWRSRPEVHEGAYFVDTGTFDSGSLYTLDLESAVVWGQFSAQSELFYNRNNSINGDLDFYGFYAYASWFLTGENRAYKRSRGMFERVTPFTNFWLVRTNSGVDAGWGAWELAARWSYLDLTDRGLTGQNRGLMNDMTVGINWHWNSHIRWSMNWIHSWNDYTVAVDGLSDGQADSLGIRCQLDF